MYKRAQYNIIKERIKEPRKFIQILAGPRQTGKTTLVQQIMEESSTRSIYALADDAEARSGIWIEQQWEKARLSVKAEPGKDIVLAIDEVQKVPEWSSTVKRLWDEDTVNKIKIRLILLGSSQLLLQKGLTESLAGRFEIIRIPHWSFAEMNQAFKFSLDQYVYYGGYPGASGLINNNSRWKQYIKDSLIETTVSKDILMMTNVNKPALLKNLFELGCLYSGQILSFNKILGQLRDAGNTTTLSHYLDLLDGAGLLCGLQKYSGREINTKSSSPKFQVLNNALISAYKPFTYQETKENPEYWGRLVESAAGAHLVNLSRGSDVRVNYWRERNAEVDFVLTKGKKITAIEVKSGVMRGTLNGMNQLKKIFPSIRVLLVGSGGIHLKDFLSMNLEDMI